MAGTVELSWARGGPGLVLETVPTRATRSVVGDGEPYVYRATATGPGADRLVAIAGEALEHQARANPGFVMTLMGVVGSS